MATFDDITPKAFIAALLQFPSSLSPEQQAKLKGIKENIVRNIENISLLDRFVETYPDFEEIYQEARAILEVPAHERGRPDFPIIDEEGEAENTELGNLVQALDKIEDTELQEILLKILDNPHAARDIMTVNGGWPRA